MEEKKGERTVIIDQQLGAARFTGNASVVRQYADGSIWVKLPNSSIEIKVEQGNYQIRKDTTENSS